MSIKSIQRYKFKSIIDKAKWNSKKHSSNPQKVRKKETNEKEDK